MPHTTIVRTAVALIAMLAMSPASSAEPLTLKTDRAVVNYGDSCTLSWTSSASAAYLTGLGKVPPKSATKVTPENSTEYTLITETDGKVEFASVRVKVTGQKGSERFPDVDDFKAGLMAQKPNIKYLDFVERIVTTLQDKLSFHVRGAHLPRQPFYIIYTDRQDRNSLVRTTDKGIRKRRIAYAVKVEEPRNNTVPFEVKVLVEYLRGGESTWRPEIDPEILIAAEQELKKLLEQ